MVYYHCCSVDPRASIWNDELETSIGNSGTWDCISDLMVIQLDKRKLYSVNRFLKLIAACASCCERLLSSDGPTAIVKMKIDYLPLIFLTDKQVKRLNSLPYKIVKDHVQVLRHNGHFYHLNPDLVYDVDEIILCHICAIDPMMKSQESIASGNDYG